MLDTFEEGEEVVFDRYYCSFTMLATKKHGFVCQISVARRVLAVKRRRAVVAVSGGI